MAASAKNFRKREAILGCLRGTQCHPSAEWVYEHVRAEMPDISLATVYRNLALFKKQGLISSVATVNGVERFDANTSDHVHFICSDCDAVIDLHKMTAPDNLASQAESGIGCQVTGCQLSFTGLCRDCLSKIHGGEAG